MGRYDLVVTVAILLCCAVVALGQTNSTNVARCFQMTWLGPRFNNDSIFENATCQDATRLAGGVPCREPLVVSYDGSWPDVDYIWQHHSQRASCILANNDVCAQFTYYFDGHVENSTYMCTRGVDNLGASITRGCYDQRNGSFVTRVCFCRSLPGQRPCNKAVTSAVVSTSLLVLAVTLIINRNFVNMCLNLIL